MEANFTAFPVCGNMRGNTYFWDTRSGVLIFEKVVIDAGKSRTFIIEARDVSSKNKYIQSANLNGKPLNSPWFNHSDLSRGGTLVLQMGPRPNEKWGNSSSKR